MLIGRIEQAASGLRPSEARVARFVLSRPHVAAELSIKDLAEAVGVSEPTVMRFCKAVGCVGFQELKRLLTRDLERRSGMVNRSVAALADADRIAVRLLEQVAREVTALAAQLDAATLEALGQAVDLVTGLRRMTVIAADPGVPRAAADMAEALQALGLTVDLATGPAEPRHPLVLVVAGAAGTGTGTVAAEAAVAAGRTAILFATGPVASTVAGRLAIVALPSAGDPLTDRLNLLVLLRALLLGARARIGAPGDARLKASALDLQASRERAQAQARRAWHLASGAGHEAPFAAAPPADAPEPVRSVPRERPDTPASAGP